MNQISDARLEAAVGPVRELFARAASEVDRLFPQVNVDFRHQHINQFVDAAVRLAVAGKGPAPVRQHSPVEAVDDGMREVTYELIEQRVVILAGEPCEFFVEHKHRAPILSWIQALQLQDQQNAAEGAKYERFLRSQGRSDAVKGVAEQWTAQSLGQISAQDRFSANVGIFMVLRRPR